MLVEFKGFSPAYLLVCPIFAADVERFFWAKIQVINICKYRYPVNNIRHPNLYEQNWEF